MCFEYQSTTITYYAGRFLTIIVVDCTYTNEVEKRSGADEIFKKKSSYPYKSATVPSLTCLSVFLKKSRFATTDDNDPTIKIYDRKYTSESLSNQYGSLITY